MLPAGASAAAGSGGRAYDFEAMQYDAVVPLSKYKGQVLVVVNIASE
jgi:glutathione peroxidase-family protein